MRLTTQTWPATPSTAHALCLHGITGSSASWWRVAQHLAERGISVTAPDLRGHGSSPRPATAYDLDQLVEDVAETVGREVDLIIGHSFGGTLALRAVAQEMLSATLTILEDPVLRLDPQQARTVVEAEIQWQPPAVNDMVKAMPSWLPQDVAGRVLAHYQMDPQAVRDCWVGNAPCDLVPELDLAATRTTLRMILPTASPYIDDALARNVAARLGDEAVCRTDCGHSVHREEFGTFVATLDAWWQETTTRSR